MTPTPDQPPRRTIPTAPTRRELRSHPAVRNYTLFCLAALFLLVVCLANRGLDWWSLLPVLVGGVALLAQWSIGPPLVLLSLTGLILVSMRSNYAWRSPYWARDQVPAMMDLILCVAVLAYVVGHYRLLALMRHVFPPDPRRPPGSGFADPARRRSADLVSVREMVVLLLALPLWTSISVVVWNWMMDDAAPLYMPEEVWQALQISRSTTTAPGTAGLYMTKEVWQALRIAWAGLAIVAATGAVAGYLRQTLAMPEEGLLHLQDQLWQQTRREQSNLHRWLARARLRARRGRERS